MATVRRVILIIVVVDFQSNLDRFPPLPLSVQASVGKTGRELIASLQVLPNHQFNTFGDKWNPESGPFNYKEHAVIVMMANVSIQGGVAYCDRRAPCPAGLLRPALRLGLPDAPRHHHPIAWASEWRVPRPPLLCLFGRHDLAPDARQRGHDVHAARPPSRRTPRRRTDGPVGRYRYFLYVFTGSFFWYWFPGWIAQGLSCFDWICWIAPNNLIVNQLFGNNTGLVSSPSPLIGP